MNKLKKLSEIELQLTPLEWAIGLADEMRRHPSANEFMKSAAKEAPLYQELPYVKPFYVLRKQAEQLYPAAERKGEHAKSGSKDKLRGEYQLRQDLHAQIKLNKKLRWKYHLLKILISAVNTELQDRTKTLRLMAGMKLSSLEAVITHDAMRHVATRATSWIERHWASEGDEEARALLTELAACANSSFEEERAGSLPLAVVGCPRASLQMADLADDLSALLAHVFASKSAVAMVQEQYFDGHSVLWRDNEAALEMAIRTILDAVAIFNEYVERGLPSSAEKKREANPERTGQDPSKGKDNLIVDSAAIQQFSESLAMNIVNDWVSSAEETATRDILKEDGRHEEFAFKCLREKYGIDRKKN